MRHRSRRFTSATLLVMIVLLLAGPTAAGAAEPPPTTVYSPPASIDASGTVDVTRELKRFIASVPDGSVASFPTGARYRVEGVVPIRDRVGLTIEGNGAEFFATTTGGAAHAPDELAHLWPRHRAHWWVLGGRDITIRNVVITGANPYSGLDDRAWVPALEAQHGLELSGVDGALVEGCKIRRTYGDLVSITEGSSNVTVRGCTLADAGRQGVTVDRGSDVMIRDNWIGRIRRSVIDLEPAAAWETVRQVQVVDNQVGRARHIFVASLGLGSVDDVLVQGNVMQGGPMQIVVSGGPDARRRGWRIRDNTSATHYSGLVPLFRLINVDGVEVSGNHQPFNQYRPMNAVELTGSCDWSVSDNQFPGSVTELVGARDCPTSLER